MTTTLMSLYTGVPGLLLSLLAALILLGPHPQAAMATLDPAPDQHEMECAVALDLDGAAASSACATDYPRLRSPDVLQQVLQAHEQATRACLDRPDPGACLPSVGYPAGADQALLRNLVAKLQAGRCGQSSGWALLSGAARFALPVGVLLCGFALMLYFTPRRPQPVA